MPNTRHFLRLLAWALTPCCACLAQPATPNSEAEKGLHPRARISTSLGDIVVELNAEAAPVTVMNFVDYAKSGFYEGTVFHRVTEHVVQGGAYTADMDEKTKGLREPISVSESMLGLPNERAAIAMYRDPMKRNSVRTQFFINLQDNSTSLDKLRDGFGYTVFGKVVEGMEVAEKIAKLPTSTHPKYAAGRNPVVPKDMPIIKSVTIVGELDREKAEEIAKKQEAERNDPVAIHVRELEQQHGVKSKRTESGLIYLDIKEGTGAFPLEDDTVEVEFEACVVGQPRTPFDSSKAQWDGPGKVPLKSAIPGLREGLTTMREHGRRILIIPPKLGFPEGIPHKIPADATLEYDVTLHGVFREEPDR